MTLRTKIVAGALVVLAIAAGFAIKPLLEYRSALNSISHDPELGVLYDTAKKKEFDLKNSPTSEMYGSAAFAWKSLGDATGQVYFYHKALSDLSRALANEKTRSALLYLNQGNVYRALHDYAHADASYQKAIQMAPGDDTMWRPLLDMYENDWKIKTPDDILHWYDLALNALLFTPNVELMKADYLERIGRFDESLRIYESVKASFPDQTGLNDKIQTLKYEIEQAQKNKMPK